MSPQARAASWRGTRLFTIGHSTRTLDELVTLLRAFDVAIVADVRTVPRSRRNPQFEADALRRSLVERGLRYVHLPELGGLRHPRKDSPNTGWRNASFRGFADYMASEQFAAGLERLRALAGEGRVALMCAEAVPWRCHRSLIADALSVRGAEVRHITSARQASPHRMTPFARVEGTIVRYPDPAGEAGSVAGASAALATDASFHLEATVRVLQRRPANPVDLWNDGCYRRELATSQGLVLVEVANEGTIDRPALRLLVRAGASSPEAQSELAPTLRRVLGLDVRPDLVQRVADAVPALRTTARALRGMRPPRFPSLFETFANVVPYQQVSLDAGVAVVRRLVERFGEALEHDGRPYRAFPAAARIADARPTSLRACGLSTRKAEALRAIAREIASGSLDEEALAALDSSEAMRLLRALPGIGPWSAALVLLRGLGRLDVFPPGDVGARRGLTELLQIDSPARLDAIVEQLGDRRGGLYFFALGAKLFHRGWIHPAPALPRRS